MNPEPSLSPTCTARRARAANESAARLSPRTYKEGGEDIPGSARRKPPEEELSQIRRVHCPIRARSKSGCPSLCRAPSARTRAPSPPDPSRWKEKKKVCCCCYRGSSVRFVFLLLSRKNEEDARMRHARPSDECVSVLWRRTAARNSCARTHPRDEFIPSRTTYRSAPTWSTLVTSIRQAPQRHRQKLEILSSHTRKNLEGHVVREAS
ncbi:hypothetical protein FB451DRAFT_71455 [Mycena latifolia]|nr:hypothetical protein FB451DRAFT_71455 [Mycena latifolia]